MRRLLAALILVAATFGGVVAVDDKPADASAYNCWSSGNASGTAFLGRCQGSGSFRVKAVCTDVDGNRPYTKTGSLAYAPNGYSRGYCKLGWHPGSTWIAAS